MRKLEGIFKKECDVLIVDHVTSEWVKYCIPKERTVFVLKIHDTLPFVKSFSFLYNLIGYFIRTRLISLSLLSAIILDLKPKVVITLADNNRFMGPLQSIFPDLLFISAQNGIRATDPSFKSCGKYLSFPKYFGFGDYERLIMKKNDAKVEKYYSQGSLRMGVFLCYLYNPARKRNNKNICLISQYVGKVENELVNEFYSKFREIYQNISRLLFKYSQECNVDISIAMRSESSDKEYQNELMFYKSIFNNYNNVMYHANDRKNMTSYQVGMDSDLVISFDSTLLFELFGAGKKVLCCGNSDIEYNDLWSDIEGFGNKGQCENLPDSLLLHRWSYGEFKVKTNALLQMSSSNYSSKTKKPREYYMNFNSEYPHQTVYNLIQSRIR
jgi:surface carbohydrate biosynthesis protein